MRFVRERTSKICGYMDTSVYEPQYTRKGTFVHRILCYERAEASQKLLASRVFMDYIIYSRERFRAFLV